MINQRFVRFVLHAPISQLFSDPREKLREIMMGLTELSAFLRKIERRESFEPLYDIVDFFGSVSKWHDRGLGDVIAAFSAANYGQWDGVIERLKALDAHFVSAGRNSYGWNRTERGETVTSGRVFLGNVQGLFTHPVSYWVVKKFEPKGLHPDFPALNAYDMVLYQARRFTRSHAIPMVGLIEELAYDLLGRRAA